MNKNTMTTPGRRAVAKDLRPKSNPKGGSDALELQNAMQQQQQAFALTSNISKALYDTSLATIRKIGS